MFSLFSLFVLTSKGAAHTAIVGIKTVYEYPYMHNKETYTISDPKHFIMKYNIAGTPNPIE